MAVDGGGLSVTAWSTHRALPEAADRIRSAIYVFMSTLCGLSRLITPGARVVVAWDGRDNRRFRRGRHPWYKHGRGSVINREEVRTVVSECGPLLMALGCCQLELEGHEADDLVATAASQIPGTILVFSDDADYYQLVSERVHLCRRSMDGIIVDPDSARLSGQRVGEPYLHLKCLMGDFGDNIRGLDQIGQSKADMAISQHPGLVQQCLEDPGLVDWTPLDEKLRRQFAKAGRRLLSPTELRDRDFATKFARRRGLSPPPEPDVDESTCLAAAASEAVRCLGLVAMRRDLPIGGLSFPEANVEAIPGHLQRLGLDDEHDLHSSMYRMAGMSPRPGSLPPWRPAARAGAEVRDGDQF